MLYVVYNSQQYYNLIMTKTTAVIIREAVEAKRFSYRQLAKLAKIDHAFLCNIAKGKKSPPKRESFYEMLASALGLKQEDIFELQMLQIVKGLNSNPGLATQVYDLIASSQSSDQEPRSKGLSVIEEEFQAFADGEPLSLTYKEFQLLAYLFNSPGRVLTRDVLLSAVWGFDYFGGTRTVDVHIRRLRAKLEPRYHDNIETVRNIGYRFRKK